MLLAYIVLQCSLVGKVESAPLREETGGDVGSPVEEGDVDLDVLVGLGRLKVAESDGDVAARRVPQVRGGRGRRHGKLGDWAILGGSGELR